MVFDDAFESGTLCAFSDVNSQALPTSSRRSTLQPQNMSWLQNPSWTSSPGCMPSFEADPFGMSLQSAVSAEPAVKAAVQQYFRDDGTQDDVTSSFFLMKFAAERDLDPQVLLSSCSRFRSGGMEELECESPHSGALALHRRRQSLSGGSEKEAPRAEGETDVGYEAGAE